MTKSKGKDASREESVGLNWLACDVCSGWDIFENTGITGPYNEKLAQKTSFTCRHCKIIQRLDDLTTQVSKLQTQLTKADIEKWSDVVKKIPAEVKEHTDKVMAENKTRMEAELANIKSNSHTRDSVDIDQTLSAPQLRQATSEMHEVET